MIHEPRCGGVLRFRARKPWSVPCLHKAIGKQLTCVFVDHGLLRLNEAAQVMATFAQHMHVKVIHVDASADMFRALKGVADPENKRDKG